MNIPVPLIPDNAPFSPEQRAWLNGFLAGVFSRNAEAAAAPAPREAPAPLAPLTILFGSQTGTAEGLAKKAAKAAGQRGFAAMILDMAQADLARLAGETNLLVITSTFGEGEPPDNARALHAAFKANVGGVPSSSALASATAEPRMDGVRFSVCALGDTNYVQFCQCGKDFDTWLERLGAVRAAPRADCDLDYEEKFTRWLDAALAALGSPAVGAALRRDESAESRDKPAPTIEEPGYSRSNPFPAPVLAVRNLSGPGSAKEVNHVEFSLDGSGLAYEVGDALGVVPQNCSALVAEVLAALGCDGEEAVPGPDGANTSLRRALTECYDLGRPTAELIEAAGAALPRAKGVESRGNPAPTTLAAAAAHHVIDVLLAASVKPSPLDFVARLKKIQPRLYSISSSPKAHPGQVHLTVAAVRYDHEGRARKGLCSSFLAERAVSAGKVGVFVHANRNFRPPPSADTPMIMVGPGTGIAPFRAFLAERHAAGARGKNWLFFGDQRAATDLLYREELAALMRAGTLARLDLAFSRDQAEKVYVQHRMLENAAELYAWLEDGAHFYVCGDASRMAKDVDAALHKVIETAGARSPADAAAYVQALKAAKRYARDVY